MVLICLTMCPINWKGRNQRSDVRDRLKINPKINCKGAEINGDSSQIINEEFQAAQVAKQSQIDHKNLMTDWFYSQEHCWGIFCNFRTFPPERRQLIRLILKGHKWA